MPGLRWLHQRRVMLALLVLRRRRQGLLGWRPQVMYKTRC